MTEVRWLDDEEQRAWRSLMTMQDGLRSSSTGSCVTAADCPTRTTRCWPTSRSHRRDGFGRSSSADCCAGRRAASPTPGLHGEARPRLARTVCHRSARGGRHHHPSGPRPHHGGGPAARGQRARRVHRPAHQCRLKMPHRHRRQGPQTVNHPEDEPRRTQRPPTRNTGAAAPPHLARTRGHTARQPRSLAIGTPQRSLMYRQAPAPTLAPDSAYPRSRTCDPQHISRKRIAAADPLLQQPGDAEAPVGTGLTGLPVEFELITEHSMCQAGTVLHCECHTISRSVPALLHSAESAWNRLAPPLSGSTRWPGRRSPSRSPLIST